MDIDPENIESISVLKGANAAALYGSRAANGVVLVTTKSGKSKKAGIGVSVNTGVTFDQPYRFVRYQNSYGQGLSGSEYYYIASGAKSAGVSYQDFADGTWNGNYGFSYYDGNNGGVYDGVDESWGPRLDIGLNIPQFNSPLSDPNDPDTRQATPWVSNPNNVKDFFQLGSTYDFNANITSNTEKNNMRLSLSSQSSKGTIPNTDLTKYTIFFNGTQNLTDWLKVNVAANYVNNSSDNLPGQGYDPNNPMQSLGGWFGRQVDMNDLEENWQTFNVFGNPYNWNTNYHNNPYWTTGYNTTSRDRDRIFGNFNMTVNFTDWLSATARVGIDYYAERRKHVEYTRSIDYPYGFFWQNNRTDAEFNADLTLNFNKEFGDFSVNGFVGANSRHSEYHYSLLQASELTVPNLFTIGNIQGNPTTGMYDEMLETNSVFGQASIGWKNAIYLDVTARNDWSSTLPQDSWSYFYPSFTGSFIVTEFLDVNPDILSFAKIRGGWAQVGNSTNPYQLSFVYESNDPYNGVTPFFTTRTLPPVGLKPESTTSIEAGVDLRFLNNRIGLDVTYYDMVTTDQILTVNVSRSTGYGSMLINAGEIENKGIEVQLNGDIVKTDAFSWNMVVNWAKNSNMVNELYTDPVTGEKVEAYQISSSWNGVTIEARPGKPFGVIRANGFLRDDNGNKIIGSNGLPIPAETPLEVGNITPDWTGGIKNTFSYKGVSLGVLIDGRFGGDLFSVSDWFGAYAGLTEETAADGIREHGLVVEGVNEAGEPNNVVVSAASYYGGYWGLEEYSIIDGSYIKLRELTLTYKLPKTLTNKIGFIQSASISLVGRNLGILYTHPSNDLGIDPETGFGVTNGGIGLEQFQLPTARNLGFKLNFNF
jgi:TonB-linked SusC/RagA family outer membrane protein